MSISLLHFFPRLRARTRRLERVERASADCLAIVWPHITSVVRSMSGNEAHGYLRAHAALHVTRHIGEQDRRFYDSVVERVVQMLEHRVLQPRPAVVVRRAA
jgi:hypothetical protein